MDDKYIKILNLIEEINLKYLKLISKQKKSYIDKFKNVIFHPIQTIVIHLKMRNIVNKYHDENNFDIANDVMLNKKKPRIAVYTCVTGNYDEICDPMIDCDNIDYFLFTDNSKYKSDKWIVKEIKPMIKSKYDNLNINRYYKFHPFEIIDSKKYDFSIYIDGNVCVVSDLTTLSFAANKKTGLALHRHCYRDSMYEEAKACCVFKKGNKDKILEQVKRYRNDGFPEDYGLFECNVIVSDLNNRNAQEIFDKWWDDFNLSCSNRDQLSLPYVLWKLGYSKNDIGCLGENVYRNPKFIFNNHK